MGDNVYKGFYPFLLGKIKEHQETIDKQNPRDLLDFLLIETDTNERIKSIIEKVLSNLLLTA